jgi:hypothetical protein
MDRHTTPLHTTRRAEALYESDVRLSWEAACSQAEAERDSFVRTGCAPTVFVSMSTLSDGSVIL